MEKKKKIYLSGPISGYDYEERKDVFGKIKDILETMGYDVSNPLDNGLSNMATTHQHMRRDLKMLLDCDEIFMLCDWNRSAGCKTELDVAVAAGMEVWFETPFTPSEIISPLCRLSVVKTGFK